MAVMEVLNKLAEWRAVFAGWQLGTRPDTDGETLALRDHREVTILLRAEVSALLGLLMQKGVITTHQWERALAEEASRLDHDYEAKFPGFSTDQDGVHMDVAQAAETVSRLHFPL